MNKRMTNLFEETKEFLENADKTPEDVKWIGSKTYGYFNWNQFKEIADEEYYSGYGAQEVASDLVVVGDDFWLERREYDGAEGWSFKEIPTKPDNHKVPKTLVGGSWEGIASINKEHITIGLMKNLMNF
mgnify:FL=1